MKVFFANLINGRADMASPSEFDVLLIRAAEKELGAFFQAVETLFGMDPAQQSAQEWISQLGSMDWSPEQVPSTLRALTIATAARLAPRLAYNREPIRPAS